MTPHARLLSYLLVGLLGVMTGSHLTSRLTARPVWWKSPQIAQAIFDIGTSDPVWYDAPGYAISWEDGPARKYWLVSPISLRRSDSYQIAYTVTRDDGGLCSAHMRVVLGAGPRRVPLEDEQDGRAYVLYTEQAAGVWDFWALVQVDRCMNLGERTPRARQERLGRPDGRDDRYLGKIERRAAMVGDQ